MPRSTIGRLACTFHIDKLTNQSRAGPAGGDEGKYTIYEYPGNPNGSANAFTFITPTWFPEDLSKESVVCTLSRTATGLERIHVTTTSVLHGPPSRLGSNGGYWNLFTSGFSDRQKPFSCDTSVKPNHFSFRGARESAFVLPPSVSPWSASELGRLELFGVRLGLVRLGLLGLDLLLFSLRLLRLSDIEGLCVNVA